MSTLPPSDDRRLAENPRVAVDGMLIGGGVSGVETATYGFAVAAARYGRCHYTFFLPQASPLPEVVGDRLQTVRCRIPGRSKGLRMLHQHAVLPRLVAKAGCDILHCPGYLAPMRNRLPVVLTVPDLIAFSHPRLCRPATVLNYRAQLPGAIRRAARIVAPSEFTRRAIGQRFPAAAPRVRTVPLAVDEQFLDDGAPGEGERIRQLYGLPPRFILFVGQIEPKKNLPGLLAAYGELRRLGACDHQLVVVGNRGWEKRELPLLARELGFGDALIMPGFVPRGDLPAFYRAAELFVFPSFCEGFGLPPLEAMACGTPVVVSDGGALPEVVGDAGVVIPRPDAASLAQTICALLKDPDRLRRLGKAGRLRAANFSWRKHVADTEKIYCEAVGRRLSG